MPLYITAALITIPSLLYLFVVVPSVTQVWSSSGLFAYLIFFIYLLLFSLSSLFHAAFTDPGIIPKQPATPVPAETRDVQIASDLIYSLRWCSTCNIFRPPRASHCNQCNNCVLEYDHHCPWVGTCIGKRNYRYFYSFVIAVILLLVQGAVVIFSEMYLLAREYQKSHPDVGISEALVETGITGAGFVSLILLVFSILMALSLLSLGCYHTFLIIAAQTTHEHQRGFYESRELGSPWDRGSTCENCAASLCSPWTPSYVNLEEIESAATIEGSLL